MALLEARSAVFVFMRVGAQWHAGLRCRHAVGGWGACVVWVAWARSLKWLDGYAQRHSGDRHWG